MENLPLKQVKLYFTQKDDAGQTWEGFFTVKCKLTVKDRYALELERTALMAGAVNPSMGLAGISTTIANLRTRIIDGPEWWKQSNGGLDIEDEDVVFKLYEFVMQQEVTWRDSLNKAAKESAEVTKKTNPESAELGNG